MCNNYFKFQNSYYKQITGTAMGCPASVPIAEIVMQSIENNINSLLPDEILFWRRYVDDVFIISKIEHHDLILNTANSICPAIQFTSEVEEDHKISFLDIFIHFNTFSKSFETSVYRKPTFTGQYLNFHSCSPSSHKINIFRNLVNRAKAYCNSDIAYNLEIKRIFSDLINNGYPKKWLNRIYQERFSIPTHTPNPPNNTVAHNKCHISIPYYAGLSERISNILRVHQVLTTFKPQTKLYKFFNSHFSTYSPYDALNVIYQINCSKCNAAYIGETSRTAKIRIQEHQRSFKNSSQISKLVLHALDTDHPPDFSNVKILSTGASNYHSRIFLEGWFTRQHRHAINDASAIPSEYSILI